MKTFNDLAATSQLENGAILAANNAANTVTNKITFQNMKDQILNGTVTDISVSGTTLSVSKYGSANPETYTTQDTDTTYNTGNSEVAGITKLYGTTGYATDGAMTQAAVTNLPYVSDLTVDGRTITFTKNADANPHTIQTQDTTYSAGDGVKLDSGSFKADLRSATRSALSSASKGSTANREYAVGLDADGYLSVNVPWENDNTTYTATNGVMLSGNSIQAELASNTASSLTAASMGEVSGRQYAVGLDANGDLSVNIPWENTTYTASAGAKIESGVIKADLKSATASSLTAATKGSMADREYAVGLDANGNLSVNVPWVNIEHHATGGIIYQNHDFSLDLQTSTLSALTAATRGSVTDREYAVGLDANGKLSVNVPWTDNNTVYTASDGIVYSNDNFSADLKSTVHSALTAAAKTNVTDREYAVGLDANGNLSVNVPWTEHPTYHTGTASVEGFTKLYTGTGSNTDGTMTQAAITAALGNVVGNSYIIADELPIVGDTGKVYLIPSDNPLLDEMEQYIWVQDDPTDPTDGHYEQIGTTSVDLSGYYTSTQTDNAISTALTNYNPGVTSITAGTGLAGGTITGTGTIDLAGSGVVAGSYGPSADVTGTNGTTLSVPQYAIDAYGRVTGVTNRTYTSVDTTYTASTGIVLDSGQFKADLKNTSLSSLTAAVKGETTDREYAVGLDANGKLSVNVPWENTNTTYTASTGIVLDNGVLKANLKDTTASALTAGSRSTTANREYPVGLDANGNLSVNVPWENIAHTATDGIIYENHGFRLNLKSNTASALTAAARGNTTDREYAVGLDANGNLSVNVPWTDTVTTYTPATLGFGYGVCSTAYSEANKAVTIANYVLTVGGFLAVKFTADVVGAATLNVNGTGAKPIFYDGVAVAVGDISAGLTAIMVYDGTNFNVVGLFPVAGGAADSFDGGDEDAGLT